jgi:hypothetical protein
MRESRVQKSLLNAKVNLLFYFLSLGLSFFSRKIFLDCLGAEFLGLSGTLTNILGFLSLAEMGVGTAVAFNLYKPLAEDNRLKISELVFVSPNRNLYMHSISHTKLLHSFNFQKFPD